ncbi:MAG: DUF1392 domain-containing protein [Nostoc indistinguendum CM1-VF10]|nr:DUF1392 domain-containing protein [Nostoc indistinguendum CM1-VF10]
MVEISFDHHEYYADDKLIASISHDDNHLTQRWVAKPIRNYQFAIRSYFLVGARPTQNQIIGTGELEAIKVQKPAFVLGERVMLCSHDKGTKQRLILGIGLVNNSWFYLVELVSPTLTQSRTISNRFSLVGEKSLVRVNV